MSDKYIYQLGDMYVSIHIHIYTYKWVIYTYMRIYTYMYMQIRVLWASQRKWVICIYINEWYMYVDVYNIYVHVNTCVVTFTKKMSDIYMKLNDI